MKLINLVGPPGSGKTTYSRKLIQEYPEYKLLTIDNFRLKYEEEDAWYNLMVACVNLDNVILETSGLSWRLQDHILNHPKIIERGIKTIVFHGLSADFIRRVKIRRKKAIPFKYKKLTHEGLIKKCHVELPQRYYDATFICTDNSVNPKKQYELFKSVILGEKNEAL